AGREPPPAARRAVAFAGKPQPSAPLQGGPLRLRRRPVPAGSTPDHASATTAGRRRASSAPHRSTRPVPRPAPGPFDSAGAAAWPGSASPLVPDPPERPHAGRATAGAPPTPARSTLSRAVHDRTGGGLRADST